MTDLAAAQAHLVAALTGTGTVPPGFSPSRVEIARKALLRKRCGEIAKNWPVTAALLGERFGAEFARWAAARPTQGSVQDGWNFLAYLAARAQLPAPARLELAERRLQWRHRPGEHPHRRRFPAARIVQGRLLIQIGGRVRAFPSERA